MGEMKISVCFYPSLIECRKISQNESCIHIHILTFDTTIYFSSGPIHFIFVRNSFCDFHVHSWFIWKIENEFGNFKGFIRHTHHFFKKKKVNQTRPKKNYIYYVRHPQTTNKTDILILHAMNALPHVEVLNFSFISTYRFIYRLQFK